MADMIDDVLVTEGWVNAHTHSGITAGKALMIQNKGPYHILLTARTAQPSIRSTSGFRILPNQIWACDAGDVVWIRGEGDITAVCVQEA